MAIGSPFGKDVENPYIKPQGDMPPLDCVPVDLDMPDMLLFAAWAHGLTRRKSVDKLALFLYVQTHIANKSLDKLEEVIHASLCWEKDRHGMFMLTELGLNELKRFGKPQSEHPFTTRYTISTDVYGKTYAIRFDSSGKKSTYFNGHTTPATVVMKKLIEEGVRFYTDETWPLEVVYQWLISDTIYYWRRNG